MKKIFFILFVFGSTAYAAELPEPVLDTDRQSLEESVGGEEELGEKIKKNFSGDTRFRFYTYSPEIAVWQLSSFTQRTRFRYSQGEKKQEIGWLINRHKDEPSVSLGNFSRYELIKYWLKMENSLHLDKIIFGNYELQYNQGLVFYFPYFELVRPWQIKPYGIIEDKGTNRNAYLFGVAANKSVGQFQIDGFLSRKKLDSSVNADGSADYNLREDTKESLPLDSEKSLSRYRSLEEKLVGGKIEYRWQKNSSINLLGYTAEYTPEIKPNPAEEFLFQGRQNTILGIGGKHEWKDIRLVAEFADNYRHGQAWSSGVFWHKEPLVFWLTAWDYSPDFNNPYASSLISYGRRDEIFNETGQALGMEFKNKLNKINIYALPAKYKFPQRTINILDTFNEWWLDYTHFFGKNWEIYANYQMLDYDVNRNPNYPFSANSKGLDLELQTRRNRYQLSWQASRQWKFRLRTDYKRGEFPVLAKKTVSRLHRIGIEYEPFRPLHINLWAIYFKAPDLIISDIEAFWPNVYLPTFWLARGKGQRYALQISQKFYAMVLWLRYEISLYSQETAKETRAFKIQWDWKW